MISAEMDTEVFTLETLLQYFSLAVSQAEQKVEAAQGAPSLSTTSISVDLELVKRPNELYGFASAECRNAIKCKIFKIAGQDAKFLMEESERTGHV